jgi:SAM-dependent methyltransferase
MMPLHTNRSRSTTMPSRPKLRETASPVWYVEPRPPSKAAWKQLRRTRESLLRELMNIEIRSMDLNGAVLDVGGGLRASYGAWLDGTAPLISVNIDRSMQPTVVADLAEGLPFEDASFDAVISFNTLEHLADDQLALDEMIRVLRPRAKLRVLVPYLWRVHGHPHDYHRHTAEGWHVMLLRAGVPAELQQIRPLLWDPFATAWAIADVAPLGRNWWRARRLLRPLVLARPLVMRPIDRRLAASAHVIQSEYALAYSIEAEKPG